MRKQYLPTIFFQQKIGKYELKVVLQTSDAEKMLLCSMQISLAEM